MKVGFVMMLEGKPSQASEQETMDAIKGILSESGPSMPLHEVRRAGPAKTRAAAQPIPGLQPVQNIDAKVKRAKFTTIPDAPANQEAPSAQAVPLDSLSLAPVENVPSAVASHSATRANRVAPESRVVGKDFDLKRNIQQVKRFRFLFLMAAVYFFPHVFVIGAAVFLFVVVGAFLTLGAERIWGFCVHVLARYERHRPVRGAKLRQRLDSIALRWDAVLDRFPDGLVDDLYMPDWSSSDLMAASHDRIIEDRLARMHSQA